MPRQQQINLETGDYKYAIAQYYGEENDGDDFAIVFTDDPEDENEGYSCRGTFKGVVEDIIDIPDAYGDNDNLAAIITALLFLEHVADSL